MRPELAAAIAAALVRLAFAFLPVSFNGFGFNKDARDEVEEALNANASRILLATWLPTALAIATSMAAATGQNNIKYLEFIAALLVCASVWLAVWKLVPVRFLRSGRTAKAIVLAMLVMDLMFFLWLQSAAVNLFLAAPGH